MNGVRRFFATANLKSPSGSEASEATSPSPIEPSGFVPLLTNNPRKQSNSSSNFGDHGPPSDLGPLSPANTQTRNTPALFIRKEDSNLPNLRKGEPLVNGGTEHPTSYSNNTHQTSKLSIQDSKNELGPNSQPTSYMNGPSPRFPAPSSSGQLNSKLNIRDDLLLSLLTSEALLDSQSYEILTGEEVERLKQERELLASRIGAVKKKLDLELKIRKASLNLQKLKASKAQTGSTDDKDSINSKLESINAELVQTLEKLFGVDRALLQHQSGVLGQSVRNVERQLTPDNHTQSTTEIPTSPGTHTRSSSSGTSISTRAKFEGAHLFAGHAHSILPTSLSLRHNQSSDKHRIASLEEKLKVSDEAKTFTEMKLTSLEEEFRRLGERNIKLEKSYELQLRNAQDMIHELEKRLSDSPDPSRVQEQQERQRKVWDNERKQWDLDREGWKQIQQDWERDRQVLEDSVKSQRDMILILEKKVEDLEAIRSEKDNLEQLVIQRDNELQRLNEIIEQDRGSWEAEKIRLQGEIQRAQNIIHDSRSDKMANEALSELRDILEDLVELHEIPHNPQDKGALTLMSSVRNHLTLVTTRMKSAMEEKVGLEDQLRIYETDLRKSSEMHEQLRQELAAVKKSGNETSTFMPASKDPSEPEEPPEVRISVSDAPTAVESEEYSKVIHSLKELWAILPSVESRAARLPKGGSISPISPIMASSLSDLDVRALKSLYDSKQGFVSPVVVGQFSIEEFVRRVHALINDDRALIERLLRFAQSHDLLRNNAERAQKLAQESNKGLELYQAQVRTLEERNSVLTRKQLTMLDEISNLQQSLDMIVREKHDLEMETMEQASTIQRLTEANNALSSRNLAEETGPMAIKTKLETQLSEMRTKLLEAQNEADQLRSIESSQRAALLDELNSLQQENNQLREQLRNRK